jgi:hypothetical protein
VSELPNHFTFIADKQHSEQTSRDHKALAQQLLGRENQVAQAMVYLKSIYRTGGFQKQLWMLSLKIAEEKKLPEPSRLAKRHLLALVDWFVRRCPEMFPSTIFESGAPRPITPVIIDVPGPEDPGDYGESSDLWLTNDFLH